MRPRFQADADLNYKIVLGLRRKEPAVEFIGPLDADLISLPDPDVLKVAAAAGRILVSHDRRTMPAHFARFLRSQPSPGLIVVSQELDLGSAIDNLLLIWAATDAEEWTNRIGYVPI